MNTLKINAPKGHQIDFDQNTGTVSFPELPKSPRETINEWKDVLSFHKMTQDEFDKWTKKDRPHEVGTKECELIIAAYNRRQLEDPLPKFGTGTPLKRYPIFDFDASPGGRFAFFGVDFGRSCSAFGARLVFFDNENDNESLLNLRDAVSKFQEQFERSRTL